MIRELTLVVAALGFAAPAAAQAPPAAEPASTEPASTEPAPSKPSPETQPAPPRDETLDGVRHPIDALTEQLIGSASKSVRFDWRKKTVGVGLVGGELIERNNFGSAQLGVYVKKALGDLTVDGAVTRAWTWETESSRKLALTPFRQAARPNRFELQLNAGYPVAEGVVTALTDFVPPAELVWNVNAGGRYLLYPEVFQGLTFNDPIALGQSLAGPTLSEDELDKLEAVRLGGMTVDPSRYQLLVGTSLDCYFPPGLVIAPRALLAIPVFGIVAESSLGFWWELSVSAGWVF